MPPTEPSDPLAALSPEQRLAISAALTEAFVGEIEALAAQGRAILAERERMAAITSPRPEETAEVAA